MANMMVWLIVEIALVVPLAICGWIILRARRLNDCLVASQLAGTISVLALMVLAEGMKRPSFYNLALALALLALPAGLMFAHFLERWWR